jgi:hypothetical protein
VGMKLHDGSTHQNTWCEDITAYRMEQPLASYTQVRASFVLRCMEEVRVTTGGDGHVHPGWARRVQAGCRRAVPSLTTKIDEQGERHPGQCIDDCRFAAHDKAVDGMASCASSPWFSTLGFSGRWHRVARGGRGGQHGERVGEAAGAAADKGEKGAAGC